MTHWRQQVSKDNPNLHWWDIDGHSPIKVVIESWHSGEVRDDDGATKPKTFLNLAKAKKPFGINVTIAHIISAVLGTPDMDKWVGGEIVLRVAELTSGGKKGERCIRPDAPRGLRMPGNCAKFKYLDKGE